MTSLATPLAAQNLVTRATIHANLGTPALVEHALAKGEGKLTKHGALLVETGKFTGRSVKDKYIVRDAATESTINWGAINQPMSPEHFAVLKADFLAHLEDREELYVADLFGGSQPEYRVNVRVITQMAWHNLFIKTLLVRPTAEEVASFVPEYTIINLPSFKADPERHGCRSDTVIAVSFTEKLILIGNTEYSGEMKKGVFGLLNYLLPAQGVMPMHCSANIGADGKSAIFFGLSGTGKTTLSADASRTLIGDDEHGWSDTAVFNFEGGCYAKMINLSAEQEPEIWSALKFGSVLENVIYNPQTRVVDFADTRITDNTRGAYPIEFIENAKLPCVGPHPTNVVFLTCDAFGVLPPVARLNPAQAMYHFISGYTAKVAGTEEGVTDPEATFSACFGAPFLVWHPTKYAEMLAEKLRHHNAPTWLVNTGWSGGGHGVGARMKLKYTRAIIDAIHDGSLANAPTETDPVFGLEVPTLCKGVPSEILIPRNTWSDKAAYDRQANKVGALFRKNFEKYADKASAEVLAAAPKGEAVEGLVLKEEG